jgi:hypothetical protein
LGRLEMMSQIENNHPSDFEPTIIKKKKKKKSNKFLCLISLVEPQDSHYFSFV